MAAQVAYGSSWARVQIRGAAVVCITAIATPDLSHICDLHSNLWQHWILNPLSEARDGTCILKDTHVRFLTCWATMGTLKISFFILHFVCVCVCLLGPYPWHMEVPRLGVKWKLQLPAYTIATAMPDLSRVYDLHHSSWQCWILNPLIQARDQTYILMDTSQICYRWATMGTSFGLNMD